MHGVGIASVGYLMDAITESHLARGSLPDEGDYIAELDPLREICAWTRSTTGGLVSR